jgi:hypothetical protein
MKWILITGAAILLIIVAFRIVKLPGIIPEET